MINNWKTANEIIRTYQLLASDFSLLADECKASKYCNAIVTIKGSIRTYVFVNEDLWQQFLTARSAGALSQGAGLHSLDAEN